MIWLVDRMGVGVPLLLGRIEWNDLHMHLVHSGKWIQCVYCSDSPEIIERNEQNY